MYPKITGSSLKTLHEPIIDQETLIMCREYEEMRNVILTVGANTTLTGLMYCADCGSKMYVHRTNNS